MKTLATPAQVTEGDVLIDKAGKRFRLVAMSDEARKERRKAALAALGFDNTGGLKIGNKVFQPVQAPPADRATEALERAGLSGLNPDNQRYNKATGRYETKPKKEGEQR